MGRRRAAVDVTDTRSTRFSFWCAVLDTSTRPVAPECEVRTITGMYNAVRAPGEKRTRPTRAPLGRPRLAP